jgi:hypothetical protein
MEIEIATLEALMEILALLHMVIGLTLNGTIGRLHNYNIQLIVNYMRAGSEKVAAGAQMVVLGERMLISAREHLSLAAHLWLCAMCFIQPASMAYTLWLTPNVADLNNYPFSAREILPLVIGLPQAEGAVALTASLDSFKQTIT